jgi:hypothetical protein
MSVKITVDMQHVKTIAEILHKSLKKLQEMNVKWNMAELAVAYTEMCHEYLSDIEKQPTKGMAM